MPPKTTGILAFLKQHELPSSYEQTLIQWFIPLAETLKTRSLKKAPLIVGIQGAQGSGKSTLAALLVLLLRQNQDLRALSLSLDDFYLTRAERLRLADAVHPLLATRGVPGTHDLRLAAQTLNALCTADKNTSVATPRFDKAVDDRLSVEAWPRVKGPFDVIFLEGWCLSAPPEHDATLTQTINALEAEEDPQGQWRHYVNDFLKTDYADFFRRIELRIEVQVPSVECIFEWRALQEKKRAQKTNNEHHHLMKDAELKHFIQHFERITRNCLSALPKKADILFQLNADHEVISRVDHG